MPGGSNQKNVDRLRIGIVGLLEDDDWRVRSSAALVIEQLVRKGFLEREVLANEARLLDDEYSEVREAAATGLAHQITGEALPCFSSSPIGVFGGYSVLLKIGSGGFSEVYLVEEEGRHYAMKVPKGVSIEDGGTIKVVSGTVESCRREIFIWTELTKNRPDAVVRLIAAGLEPFPWFIMELAKSNLRNLMGQMSDQQKMVVFHQLLMKLQEIHSMGVVHKDIKPQNILLVKDVWKLSDFGLSELLYSDSESDSYELTCGTMKYMAPEQISRTKYGATDIRTDIWQMGILLVELFKGEVPFKTEDLHALAMAILVEDPDLTGLPEDIRNVAAKALQKKKDDRYQSAQEFTEGLVNIRGNL